MIRDFVKQTDDTICEFLARMGKRARIYSDHFKGVPPFEKNSHLYVYGTRNEVVLVYIDDVKETKDEKACERWDNCDRPTYVSSKGERTSPVYLLLSLMHSMEQAEKARWGKDAPHFWGIVVSNSSIINRHEMREEWRQLQVSVYDRQTDIDSLINLPIHANERLMPAIYFKTMDDFKIDKQDEDDAFEALLRQFLENGCEEVEENGCDEMKENGREEMDEDDESDEDETMLSTTGELELNPNNTVKVEILQPIKHPDRELQKLVGCKEIKERIDELITLNRYNIRMHAMNPKGKIHELSLHSIFLGRPGTGKTTVCKIMGSLLHKAGMLSKGHVVVAGRGTFVGTNWGDEERAVRQVIEMAQGGVLMIDEAYLLNSDNKNDPGKMVIPLLMEILANEKQRDLAIVLCGYKQPMLRLLELNPGLESRFPNRFEFKDFSVDELLDITKMRIGEYNYTFTPSAWDLYKSMVAEAYRVRDPQTWGNARFIANQLERIYLTHAQRCIKGDIFDKREFFSITPADIKPIEVPKAKPHIGF